MDAKTFDKSKLPSRHVTEAPSRALHRSTKGRGKAEVVCHADI